MSLSNLRYSLIEIRQSESKSHYGNESKQLDPIYAGWLKSTKNPKSLTRMKSRTEMRKTYLENQIKIVKISNQSVSMQNSIYVLQLILWSWVFYGAKFHFGLGTVKVFCWKHWYKYGKGWPIPYRLYVIANKNSHRNWAILTRRKISRQKYWHKNILGWWSFEQQIL